MDRSTAPAHPDPPGDAWPSPAVRQDTPPAEPGWELVGEYEARPVRPVLQRVVRTGLWVAVVLGCVGGLVALVRPPQTVVEPADPATAADVGVPGPVAGVAEVAVAAWLSAPAPADADGPALDELFVEPPDRPSVGGTQHVVEEVVTVAGSHQADGYWLVTLAARVVEAAVPVEDVSGGEVIPGQAVEPGLAEPTVRTWYVQVGVVGDQAHRLKALATPSILPRLPGLAGGWESGLLDAEPPAPDDPLAGTVGDFLAALLTGDGDPSRYLGAGLTIEPTDAPPFDAVEVAGLRAAAEEVDGRQRVQVLVEGTTAAGTEVGTSYEVVLAPDQDRWEVVGLSGAPTVITRPPAGTGGPGGEG